MTTRYQHIVKKKMKSFENGYAIWILVEKVDSASDHKEPT